MADSRRKCLARFSLPMLGGGKGKALVLEESVAPGDVIVVDWPDAAVPAIEEDGVPTCAHCLRSLESSHQNLERVLGLDHQQVDATLGPLAASEAPRMVSCEGAEGCPEVYCSIECRRIAWELHHCILCPLRGLEAPLPLLVAYHQQMWEVNGVDFADIFWMALRVVATALASMARDGLSLAEALQPFGAYVSADWTEISCQNPVAAYGEVEEDDGRRLHAPRDRSTLLTVLSDLPGTAAAAVAAAAGPLDDASRPKAQLVRQAIAFKSCFPPHPSGAVDALFHPHFWAHLLGMILLNSQTVSPKSPLAIFCKARPDAGHRADLKTLLGSALPVSKQYLLPVLQQSTQGIALYPLHSSINHSCAPNAEVVFEGPDAEVMVRAVRPILAGEEVCISYINLDGDRDLRQWLLEHCYLFRCQCTRCAR
eukprot:GGOE01049451.1.p1 GENE.GGOE01049451.1~~GGOE01049451.1.p1  ORF type:complete len:451 (-),score=125.20 GGOE01049451.1:43-1317(-)